MSQILNNIKIESAEMEVILKKLEAALTNLCKEESLLDGAFRINHRYADDSENFGYAVDIFEESYPPSSNHLDGTYAAASVCFFEIEHTTKTYNGYIKITISPDLLNEIGRPNTSVGEIGSSLSSFRIQPTAVDEIVGFIASACRLRIHNYKSNASFGCCGRFKECSEVKKCIHSNLLYATGCSYRKNIEKGKVFY